MKLRTLIIVGLLFCATGWAAPAAAETMAGLQVEVGSAIDANVRAEILGSIADTVRNSGNWSYVEAQRARGVMNPVVRDCFTADCLQKAGKATNARAGLRVNFSGEAEIYDWTISVFDLTSGEQLASEKGACELCGRAEVVREFRGSLESVVKATNVPSAAASKPNPTPTPEREPTTPPETPAEPTEPTATASDPTRDLVMLEVSAVPDDTIIMMNGKELGIGSVTVSLDRGSYDLVFAREGYQGFKETFVVSPQTSRRAFMRVHLSKTDPDAVIVEPTGGPIDRLGQQRVTYGIIGLAVGGGLLATGMYLNHLDGRPTCDSGEFSDCPRLHDTTTGAFLATFTGAAFVTGGAILLAWQVLAGDSETETAVAPAWTGDGLGFTLSRRF